ncbi:MAG: hypothetical protein MZU84_07965 [Sphingobacterium sp.]|nr:hypothetical protein [Sphingobacterium sp.]
MPGKNLKSPHLQSLLNPPAQQEEGRKKLWYLWLILGLGLALFLIIFKRKRDKNKN